MVRQAWSAGIFDIRRCSNNRSVIASHAATRPCVAHVLRRNQSLISYINYTNLLYIFERKSLIYKISFYSASHKTLLSLSLSLSLSSSWSSSLVFCSHHLSQFLSLSYLSLLSISPYSSLYLSLFHGRLARCLKWRACDVGEAKERLENVLRRMWNNGRVGEWAVT